MPRRWAGIAKFKLRKIQRMFQEERTIFWEVIANMLGPKLCT
jgi:hypothetical protein